jgi:hypothetical protein
MSTPILSPTPSSYPGTEKSGSAFKWGLVIILALFVLSSGFMLWQCGSGMAEGRRMANASVEHFHDQLNAGQFDQIYAESDARFQSAGSKLDILKLFEAIHRKLGNTKSQTLSFWNMNATTSGFFITVTYDTSFERGSGQENFTWVKVGNKLSLVGYHIQSNALITE